MKGLLIFDIVIASLNIIIAIYAFYILYKFNKFGEKNIAQQTEFILCRSKQFFIISIFGTVLFIASIISLVLLENLYDMNTLSNEIQVFLYLSTAIPIASVAILIGCYINSKRKKSEQNQKELQEKERNIELEKHLSYFKENSPAIIKKYNKFVYNFIDRLSEKVNYPFVKMFNGGETPISSILVFPYRNSNSKLLLDTIKRDGLHFTESDNPELNKKIQELTEFFVKGLKKRIEETNEWQDHFTLPLLLYKIVRNNVIEYYHDKYLAEYGFESLEELCKNVPNCVFDADGGIEILSNINSLSKVVATIGTVYYVYYFIYENDIDLPFVDTYKKICLEAQTIRAQSTEKKLEDDLFGSSKKQNIATHHPVATALSPIDQVDNMSGAEFEIFMTQYFQKQGFKTIHTPISGDYGIDLIIENDFGKIGVQAKCYKNKVSLDAVQQVVAGLRYYGLSSGLVITNSYFQPSAIKLAASNNITLWDRNKLIEKLGK